jgi:hypothetical protein
MGSLIPADGETPRFAQIYMYDSTYDQVNHPLAKVHLPDQQMVVFREGTDITDAHIGKGQHSQNNID